MKPFRIILILTCIVAFPRFLFAQVEGWIYRYDTSIKVYGYGGVQKTLAWCGGFDNPKFTMGDLNNDGQQDLVVYDRGVGVRTFINTGGANYVYAPQYEKNFPPVLNYLFLVDYNRDGVPDLVQQGLTGVPGFDLWRGYYNAANQLCFAHYQQLYYNNAGYGTANAYVSPSDVPAIVDLDHDGDIDFLSYETLGSYIYYYKNVQVEEGLPADTVRIKLKDQCWGKIQQTYKLSYYLNSNCNNSNLVLGPGEKTTHTGNAICLLDLDGDGDMDYLGGNVSYPNIVSCINGRIPFRASGPDSMISQDTAWQSTGHSLSLPTWPAIFNVDIDRDGKPDLLISPNSTGENYKCIAFYKNIGTASAPVFNYQGDTFLIDRTIDVGTAAQPMFFDYNKDGKPDLFIGSDGYFQPGGTYKSRVAYYMNTSTPGHPSFTLQTTNFLNLDTFNFKGTALAVGDLDNDGKEDLVIGHTNGSFSLFTNTAASDAVQPIWQISQIVLKDITNTAINIGGNATPFIYDLDKDGKPDLISGEFGGYLQYYQNVASTSGVVMLKKVNDDIGGVAVDGGGSGRYSYPFIGKMDTTGKDYLLLGSNSGLLYRYDGFQSGDTTVKYTLKDSMYSWIDTTYLYLLHPGQDSGIYNGFRSAPAIADIDGDGFYEMIVGDVFGGVKMYKQDSTIHLNVPVMKKALSLNVYPNPAGNIVNISWDNALQQGAEIYITDMTGRQVAFQYVHANTLFTSVPLGSLPGGVYIIMFRSEQGNAYRKLSIMR